MAMRDPFNRPNADQLGSGLSRRRFLQGGVALGGAVLLGACGGDDDASSPSSAAPGSTGAPGSSAAPGSTGAPASSVVVTPASTAPASQVRTGGRFRAGIANGGSADTLDPARAT